MTPMTPMSPSIPQRFLDVQSRLRRLDAVLADLASKPIVPVTQQSEAA